MSACKKLCDYFNGKKANDEARDKWSSNLTFIVASIGCSVGLGNLWRFPYLCYKWGGGLFFIPYLLCLFGMGIPMLMLEFCLGQTLQKGNIEVWAKIHPRLYGVGVSTCLACYLITLYYNVIISWSLTLFFNAFKNPLPWSVQRIDDQKCKGQYYITEEWFYKDILHIYNDDCSAYETQHSMGDDSKFQWQVFLCMILTWVCCFICVFQGVKISSKIVWFTVPMPVILVFIMVMNGFTLKNSDYGFRMYLKGYVNDEPIDSTKKISQSAMWSDACGQIFFSIGICMGVMVSYASYQPKNAPVITNSFAVSLGNSCFSFFAGFAVFSTVGYLVGINSPVSNKVSSIGLAFIAYPAALETLPGANFWTILLSVTLFTLGIDSAFAMVEGTVTVVCDSKIGDRLSKFWISVILCGLGAAISTLFCFNWGFAFFDVVDHYLCVYLLFLMGILQSVSVAWYYDQDEAWKKDKVSAAILIIGYFGLLIPLAWLCYFAFPEQSWVGIPVFWGWAFFIQFVSMMAAMFGSKKLTFVDWYDHILMSGVRPICARLLALHQRKMHWLEERIFEAWWCTCIKFIFPWAIYWLLVMTVQADTANKYGEYHVGWQIVGMMIPASGLILFLIPLVAVKDKPDTEFKETFSLKAAAIAEAENEHRKKRVNGGAVQMVTDASVVDPKPDIA